MSRKIFYVTTPIYYVNDVPHIGHAYTTIAADVLSRYWRLRGYQVFFLTGTDEHGQKVQQAAQEKGIEPQHHCDEVVVRFQQLWERLHICNDDFIRTTQLRHTEVVQAILQDLYDRGEIYRAPYEGWYCTPDERFWTEKDLVEGCCPDCLRPVTQIRENNYFFQMSKYQSWLVGYIQSHSDFILPLAKRNEVLGFLKNPLGDLCISRPCKRLNWGIPLPFDSDYVTYVWFDALINYISATGYRSGGKENFHELWPSAVHLIGKDILTTHAVYWPTMLKAMGLDPPHTIFAHGWWTVEGKKMSKSLCNVVEPHRLIDQYGADALRYFLLREVTFGLDGDFSHQAMIQRTNSDLANDLGNLFSRTLAMLKRYFDGSVPTPDSTLPDFGEVLEKRVVSLVDELDADLKELAFGRALGHIWEFIRLVNRYIDEKAPWALAKSSERGKLATVLYNVAEALRCIALLLAPFLPETAQEMWCQLGLKEDVRDQDLASLKHWGQLPFNLQICPARQLYPRIESDQAEKITRQVQTETDMKGDSPMPALLPPITIQDFKRVDLRTAKVIEAEAIPKSSKLLKLQVDIGNEQRTVVAGIASDYRPEELVGKTLIIVANLAPVKLMGVKSQGMILAAEGKDRLVLAAFDGEVDPGVPAK